MRQRAICAQHLASGKAIALPWVRARGRALQNGLHAERVQAIGCAIGEGPRAGVQRLASGKAIALPWVRARGRALQNGLHAERLQAIGCAIGEGPRAPRQRSSNDLVLGPPRPEGSSPMDRLRACPWAVRKQFRSARPRARTQGEPLGQPSAKRFAQIARRRIGL